MQHRSFIIRVIVCLLLGAIVNVAVAWYFCVYDGQQIAATRAADADDLQAWRDHFGADIAAPDIRWEYRGPVTTLYSLGSMDSARGKDAIDPQQPSLAVYTAGWPLRSVYTAMKSGDADWFPYVAARNMPYISDGHPRVLPAMPLWRGFTGNTLMYAAALWLIWQLWAVPFALRRHRRIKRGLCPACGYDLRGRPVPRAADADANANLCPECGVTA